MADKHSLNYEDVRELKLGASFTNNKASQYHTIKYDFKPASVDVNKMATVDVGTNNQVTVTVPHLDGAGVPQTVFKGNQRPYTKECVLIIDRVTGEITLEKLSSNIQVKKTRQETSQKPRPLTPVTNEFTNTTARSSSRTRVTTNKRTNPNPAAVSTAAANAPAARFPGAAKPSSMVRSPPRQRTSPPQAAPWSGGGNSTLASLPMIGFEDALGGLSAPAPAPPAPAPAPPHNGYLPRPPYQERPPAPQAPPAPPVDRTHHNSYVPPQPTHQPAVALQPAPQEDSSSSSSSESGSDSDSASDSDDAEPRLPALPALPTLPALANGTAAPPNPALPSDVLNDDLCLSESGSDSD